MSTTWNHELVAAIAQAGDTTDIVAKAPADESVWDCEFDPDFGLPEGEPVLAWTEARVYFPVQYDGAEWIESAPRNPVLDGQDHVSGRS